MAQMSDEQRNEVWAEIMRWWSQNREAVPMSKAEVKTLIEFMDEEAEQSDTGIINRIPAQHPARAWLIANQHLARGLKERVERKRKEVL